MDKIRAVFQIIFHGAQILTLREAADQIEASRKKEERIASLENKNTEFELDALRWRKQVLSPELTVLRHQLGMIAPQDIVYMREMSQEEMMEHDKVISSIAKMPAFRREISALVDTQVYWHAKEADGLRQQDFSKGSINGLTLVLEAFEARLQPPAKSEAPLDPYDTIPQ